MNISLSYNWIKEFVPTTLSAEEFAARLSAHGPSVERVRSAHAGMDGIVVGRVVDVRQHPNADKLRLASVDVGVEVVDVVCGGINLAAGMKVAFARIGARVRWHGAGEPVELKPAEIRGVKSFGMICAANEIGLFDLFPHAEREIMDLSSVDAVSGTPVGVALGLDDNILDIEVTTNRIDAFSVIGMAREAAAILGTTFVIPTFRVGISKRPKEIPAQHAGMTSIQHAGMTSRGVSVAVQAKHLCPRYQATVIRGAKVGASPAWIKSRLLASGLRPINAVVDIANYVMLEYGHPLHAFDAAKLGGGMIVVREARAGETIAALDSKTYLLEPGMLVIADAERPVAIAGVIGSADTGTTSETTDIVLESAAFDPVSVRKTSRALGIASDAALRFEKGIHPESTSAALARATSLVVELCGGVADPQKIDVRGAPWKARAVAYRPAAASALAGVDIPTKVQKKLLSSLGFATTSLGKTWRVVIPWWRDADIEAGERDLIEEVVRLYGYEKIPTSYSTPPGGGEKKTLVSPPSDRGEMKRGDREFVLERDLKEFFRGAGFLETQTLPLVPEEWAPDGLELENPLTSDAARLRTSLLPSLLDAVRENLDRVPEIRLFEISRIYLPRPGDLPEEPTMLIAIAAGPSLAGEQFAAAKGVAEALSARFRLPFSFSVLERDIIEEEGLHPGRALSVVAGGHEVGYIAEINPFVERGLDERTRVAVFSLDLAHAFKSQTSSAIHDVPPYPAAKRDVSFLVPDRTKHADIVAVMRQATPFLVETTLFDVFRREGKKSMAYHLAFQSPETTLTAEEVAKFESKIKKILESKFGAVIR